MRYLRRTASLAIICASVNLSAAPLGTAFTYQGRLNDGASPANDQYDFVFKLFDSPGGTNQLGVNQFFEEDVIDGLFNLVLDFGPNAFNGQARWLEISVRLADRADPHTVLQPRQQIYPTPYALMAGSVTNGAITASKMAPLSVTSQALDSTLALGGPGKGEGLLDLFDGAERIISLDAEDREMSLFGINGTAGVYFFASTGGEIRLYDYLTNDMTVRLSAGGAPVFESGGVLELFSTSIAFSPSRVRARLSAGFNFGQLDLFGSSTSPAASLSGTGLRLNYSTGNAAVDISSSLGITPSLKVYGTDGLERVRLGGTNAFGPLVGELRLYDDVGHNDAVILTATADNGGQLHLHNATGGPAISADGGSGQMRIHRSSDGADQLVLGHFGGGFVRLNSIDGLQRALLFGGVAGSLQLHNSGNALSVDVRSQFSSGNTAAWVGLNDNGAERISFAARNGATGAGGLMGVKNGVGVTTMLLAADNGLGNPSISLQDSANNLGARLQAATGGSGLELRAGGALKATLNADVVSGGLTCYDSGGVAAVRVTGEEGLMLFNASNTRTIQADGGSSQISTYGSDGLEQIRLWGAAWGEILLFDNAGNDQTVKLSSGGDSGASLNLRNSSGNDRVVINAQGGGGGGEISVRDISGTETVEILGAEASGQGGQIRLNRSNGTASIILDGDFNGEGRITTQVLQITGGADLSEKFDVQAERIEPGMVVCIDPTNPGKLIASSRAYDRTVAGIVSGAGGVKPGMLMGQAGTAADGRHPVALTGRVYALADASSGPIEPGDLLTTSDVAGHTMKVADHAQAQGAIIGKAMSSLKDGKGLVLVLVSLQ